MTDDEGDPIGYKLLRKGTPVVAADGVEIGRVTEVRDNAREHIFDGIVVKTPDGRKVFADAPEVVRIAERRVTLSISAAEAAELPEHGGALEAMRTNAQRSARRWRRRFTGR